MKERETNGCKGFLLYHEDMALLNRMLSGDGFMRVMYAVMEYMQSGKEPELTGLEDAAFELLQKKADRQAVAYADICERNRVNARKKSLKGKEAATGTEREPMEATGTERERLGANGNEREPMGATGTEREPAGATGTERERMEANGTEREPMGANGNEWEPMGATGTQLNRTEPNQTEPNQTEPNRPGPARPLPTSAQRAAFLRFREAYPKKGGMGKAEPLFYAALGEVSAEEMLDVLARQKRSEDWHKESGRYIPGPEKWLRERCWEDVPPPGYADRFVRMNLTPEQ